MNDKERKKEILKQLVRLFILLGLLAVAVGYMIYLNSAASFPEL